MTSPYTALVLNADFTPVNAYPLSLWSFGRTMLKVMKGRVMVLETYDTILRPETIAYRPPSVVALKDYVKVPRHVPFNRENLILRDDCRCQYCGETKAPRDLTFDHVVPRAAGGLTRWTNIVAACVSCNTRKASRTDIRPLREPFTPTARQMSRKRRPQIGGMHRTQLDYLYWSGILESD